MKVTEIPIGAELQMTNQFGTRKVVKIAGPEDIHPDIPELANRELGYFTFVGGGSVSRFQFIKGMLEEPGGSTIGGFCIWQHELDHGFTKLEPVPVPEQLLERAKSYVKSGYGDQYIESMMWAARDQNTSIKDINRAIAKARQDLEVSK